MPNGDYKIEVSANKVVGKMIVLDMGQKVEVDKTVELIPERYNAKTTLTAPVRSGMSDLKLELVSKN